MNWTLTLLLAALPHQEPLLNLDFSQGRLAHWEGQGFQVTTGTGSGPSLTCGVCSSDNGKTGRAGLLHRTFVVPAGAGVILFRAAALRPVDCEPGPALDVVLEAAERRIIPKQLRTATGLRRVPQLLPPTNKRLQEYVWRVADFVGQRVRIALIDDDARPGCHLICSGFRILSSDELNGQEFTAHMLRLEREKELAPMTRADSKHFMAISNTADEYTEQRLYNCETIFACFCDHFARKRFVVRPPASKMMVAVFDSQAGFEAYLGQRLSTAITGVYHRPSNRLVVYDYAQNRSFLAGKRQSADIARQMHTTLERQRVVGAFSQQARDRRNDTNISTIMHEVAHQLSFNTGLLNREGDVACWLAEGLACYCEATAGGAWQGIGEANPQRARGLSGPARGQGAFIPLRTLLASDDWLHRATGVNQVVLGYAQSWALFRLLMEERPQALRRYLAAIASRRTPEHRLEDFVQAFGNDLAGLEKRYHLYMKDLVAEQVRVER
jgi:hypothetical protein